MPVAGTAMVSVSLLSSPCRAGPGTASEATAPLPRPRRSNRPCSAGEGGRSGDGVCGVGGRRNGRRLGRRRHGSAARVLFVGERHHAVAVLTGVDGSRRRGVRAGRVRRAAAPAATTREEVDPALGPESEVAVRTSAGGREEVHAGTATSATARGKAPSSTATGAGARVADAAAPTGTTCGSAATASRARADRRAAGAAVAAAAPARVRSERGPAVRADAAPTAAVTAWDVGPTAGPAAARRRHDRGAAFDDRDGGPATAATPTASAGHTAAIAAVAAIRAGRAHAAVPAVVRRGTAAVTTSPADTDGDVVTRRHGDRRHDLAAQASVRGALSFFIFKI